MDNTTKAKKLTELVENYYLVDLTRKYKRRPPIEHSTARKILCRLFMEFINMAQQDYMTYLGVVNHASVCYLVKSWNERVFDELEEDAIYFIKRAKTLLNEVDKTSPVTY